MPAHALAVPEEARAEHVVGAPAGDRLEHALDVGRVVLPVAVDVDRRGVALVASDLEPAAERGAEAARLRMRVDARTVLAGDQRRGVARAVVDEENVDGQSMRLGRQPGDDAAYRRLLIARHHDRKAALKSGDLGRRAGLGAI